LATKQNPIKIDSDIDGRTAVSYFTRLKFDPVHNRSLLDVSIDTGRKHQIRIHSALQGYPIIGDRLHGYDTDKEDLQLSAYYLSFQCPYTHEQKVFDLRSQG
jgi:tRNA pseudouridine32 synthase/23S rRNA pseudouridine746 synthase